MSGLVLPGVFGLLGGKPRGISGSIQGASAGAGHVLREALPPSATDFEEIETLIVGGGIAGLSAAWWLERNQYRRYILLELEKDVGGNSMSGRNNISAYPWGAHYVPLPGPSAEYVRLLFEDLEIIEGYDGTGNPRYNELYLCADPHERLFFQGQWRNGIIPNHGLRREDQRQFEAFFALMDHYKILKGGDGRPAFAIPLDLSSHDPNLTLLDRISFKDFLDKQGWNSKYLRWYANYCCRDDYGVTPDRVSAWAGLHYFASRVGVGANADAQTVLTWPEGNGWIVKQLKQKFRPRTRANSLVFSIEQKEGRIHTHVMDAGSKSIRGYVSRNLIFAAPRFAAAKVIRELKDDPPRYLDVMD
jgi:phytoene dehydrogenase-like protein